MNGLCDGHQAPKKQLLSALEQLQQDYSKRLDEWENAFEEWRMMSGLMQRENAALSEQRDLPRALLRVLPGRHHILTEHALSGAGKGCYDKLSASLKAGW